MKARVRMRASMRLSRPNLCTSDIDCTNLCNSLECELIVSRTALGIDVPNAQDCVYFDQWDTTTNTTNTTSGHISIHEFMYPMELKPEARYDTLQEATA